MKVAIVGGGIGGLTAALALARKSIEVEVYEQAAAISSRRRLAPARAERGPPDRRARPAGRRCAASACCRDAVEFVRWDDGSLLLRTELGPAMEAHFGAPQLDFFRPDLHRALMRALPPGTIRLGAHVLGVDEDADDVSLLLGGGTRVRADVVVAADGIRSQVRQQLAGMDDPVFSGTVVYRGVARRADVAELHPQHVNYYWLGPRRHGVSYWISGGELLAVNCAVQDASWSAESWTLEAPPEEAIEHFAGWHEPLSSGCAAAPSSSAAPCSCGGRCGTGRTVA